MSSFFPIWDIRRLRKKKKEVTPTLAKWLTAKKLNKLSDFVRAADNWNPWLTKYHFHIYLLRQSVMEILNLEDELFKYWHSSLCRGLFRVKWQLAAEDSPANFVPLSPLKLSRHKKKKELMQDPYCPFVWKETCPSARPLGFKLLSTNIHPADESARLQGSCCVPDPDRWFPWEVSRKRPSEEDQRPSSADGTALLL